MASYRWEARALRRKETRAAVWLATQRSTAQIIRRAPSSSGDRSMGRLKLTTDAKRTKCAANAWRSVRGGIIAFLMFSVLAGYSDRAHSQTTAASQTKPENKVDFGVGGVSDSSFKFGEYNGLQNSGPFGIGNFELRGGAPYDSKSTWRWNMKGTNLGLETRNLYAEFGKQGKYRLFIGYSELLANRSDTYQTPYS